MRPIFRTSSPDGGNPWNSALKGRQPHWGLPICGKQCSANALPLPLVMSCGPMPLLDYLIGKDRNNPPEAVVP